MIIVPGIMSDLCMASYEDAQAEYLKKWGVYPATLLVSPYMLWAAYRIVAAERSSVIVIAVPGLDRDAWMLVGDKGIYFNQGA